MGGATRGNVIPCSTSAHARTHAQSLSSPYKQRFVICDPALHSTQLLLFARDRVTLLGYQPRRKINYEESDFLGTGGGLPTLPLLLQWDGQ